MKNPIVIIVLILLVGTLAFFGGMKYQENQTSGSYGRQFSQGQRFGADTGANGGTRQQRGGRNGTMMIGEIIDQDDKSITVKLPDGSSKIIFLSETTTISKALEVTKSDLKKGESVRVFGTTNSDGTVIAQNIQINPVNPKVTGGTPEP